MSLPESTPTSAPALERDGRVLAIDILRGLAILWVISFHLWADLTYKVAGADKMYFALREEIAAAHVLGTLTAFGEVVLGTGFHGVALFMVLSGLSLTMNAARRAEPAVLAGYRARFWKLLPAYWGGIAFFAGTIAVIAALQMLLDGGSFSEQWGNVRIAVIGPVDVQFSDALWAASVFGWIFGDKDGSVLVASMWFVPLLLQYYLIFPFALRLLNRIGPWRFLAIGIAVTLLSRALWISVAPTFTQPYYEARVMTALAPFRFSEFAAGMTIGWLLVHRRDETAEYVRSPFDIFGLVVIAALLQMAGAILAPKSETTRVLGDPVIGLGMAIYALPLLFKVPGWLESSLPAKALIFMGVISFPVLIINDGMRYVGSFLRLEQIPDPAWWFFLIVVYVPVGVLIAYPYALLFGLVPKQRRKRAQAASRDTQATPLDAQPAAGAG